MSNIFLCADLHLGHEKTCTTFTREDGSPLRSFANADEMDEAIIDRFNSVVKPSDIVYNLGDVVINRRNFHTLSRFNIKRENHILVRGNHDHHKLDEYTPYFGDILGVATIGKLVLTHIPIHEGSLSRYNANIHGHLHAGRVMKENEYSHKMEIDKRYFCVSLEHIDYTPISIEDLREKLRKQGVGNA